MFERLIFQRKCMRDMFRIPMFVPRDIICLRVWMRARYAQQTVIVLVETIVLMKQPTKVLWRVRRAFIHPKGRNLWNNADVYYMLAIV